MIPDYQSLMLPLLKYIKSGETYQIQYVIEDLANYFHITEDEKRELLESGRQTIFSNRVGWARTYLKQAGLIRYPFRTHIAITEAGKQVLSEHLDKIDNKYLLRFPSFVDFIRRSKSNDKLDIDASKIILHQEQTPEENLGNLYIQHRKYLALELLNKVIEFSPVLFQKIVVELLVKMGYGGSVKDAGEAIRVRGDCEIDGTIKEDKLGLDTIYVQAKFCKNINVLVGKPEIQKFIGILAGQGVKKGIFITTSSFTSDAFSYSPRNETKIVLIDGDRLSQLMIDYNIGCTYQQIYELKKIDNSYFIEE